MSPAPAYSPAGTSKEFYVTTSRGDVTNMPKRRRGSGAGHADDRVLNFTIPGWIVVQISGLRADGEEAAAGPGGAVRKHEIANIPDTAEGRDLLQELHRCHPADCVMIGDFRNVRLSLITPPLALAGEPCGEGPHYRRLKVRLKAPDATVVEVANVPATAAGLDLFLTLLDQYALTKGGSRGVFYATDYGVHPLRDVDKASIAELNGIG